MLIMRSFLFTLTVATVCDDLSLLFLSVACPETQPTGCTQNRRVLAPVTNTPPHTTARGWQSFPCAATPPAPLTSDKADRIDQDGRECAAAVKTFTSDAAGAAASGSDSDIEMAYAAVQPADQAHSDDSDADASGMKDAVSPVGAQASVLTVSDDSVPQLSPEPDADTSVDPLQLQEPSPSPAAGAAASWRPGLEHGRLSAAGRERLRARHQRRRVLAAATTPADDADLAP